MPQDESMDRDGVMARLRSAWTARQQRGLLIRDVAFPVGAAAAWVIVAGVPRAVDPLANASGMGTLGTRELLLAILRGMADVIASWPSFLVLLLLMPAVGLPRSRRLLLAGLLVAAAVTASFAGPWSLGQLFQVDSWSVGAPPLYSWTLGDLLRGLASGIDPHGVPLDEQEQARLLAWLGPWLAVALTLLAALPALVARRRLVIPWGIAIGVAVAAYAGQVAAWNLLNRVGLGHPAWRSSLLDAPFLAALLGVSLAMILAGRSRPAPAPLQRRRLAAATLACTLGWFACWAANLAVRKPERLRDWTPRLPPAVGSLAPAVTLADLDGTTRELSEFRGRPALLVFWATWCGPCLAEWPHLQEIARESGDALSVLAASVDEDRQALTDFLAADPPEARVLLAGRDAKRLYAAQGIPRTYLLDADGRVAWTLKGYSAKGMEDLRERIRALP